MVAFRFVVILGALWLAGLAVAYVVTRDRKYLRWGWRSFQVVLILFVTLGLLYVIERLIYI